MTFITLSLTQWATSDATAAAAAIQTDIHLSHDGQTTMVIIQKKTCNRNWKAKCKRKRMDNRHYPHLEV